MTELIEHEKDVHKITVERESTDEVVIDGEEADQDLVPLVVSAVNKENETFSANVNFDGETVMPQTNDGWMGHKMIAQNYDAQYAELEPNGLRETEEIASVDMEAAELIALDQDGPDVEVTAEIKTSTPSTSRGRGIKRQARGIEGKKAQKVKPEKSIKELFDATAIEQGEILLREMTRMRVIKGMEKTLRKKTNKASRLPRKGMAIKDKKLEAEVKRVVDNVIGDPSKSLAEIKRLQREQELVVEDLYIQTLRTVNTDQKQVMEHLQQLISNATLRMKVEMAGRSRLTSASSGAEKLVVVVKKPPSTIVIESSDDSEGDEGEDAESSVESETTKAHRMAEYEETTKNMHGCEYCNAVFHDLEDLDKHGLETHERMNVRRKK